MYACLCTYLRTYLCACLCTCPGDRLSASILRLEALRHRQRLVIDTGSVDFLIERSIESLAIGHNGLSFDAQLHASFAAELIVHAKHRSSGVSTVHKTFESARPDFSMTEMLAELSREQLRIFVWSSYEDVAVQVAVPHDDICYCYCYCYCYCCCYCYCDGCRYRHPSPSSSHHCTVPVPCLLLSLLPSPLLSLFLSLYPFLFPFPDVVLGLCTRMPPCRCSARSGAPSSGSSHAPAVSGLAPHGTRSLNGGMGCWTRG